MITYNFSFAKIIIHQEDIAEFIVNEGIEMNEGFVEDFHTFLKENLKAPFSILVNRMNSYSYDFISQQVLATSPGINAIAVVYYNKVAKHQVNFLSNIHRPINWNIQMFDDPKTAMQWLQKQQINRLLL